MLYFVESVMSHNTGYWPKSPPNDTIIPVLTTFSMFALCFEMMSRWNGRAMLVNLLRAVSSFLFLVTDNFLDNSIIFIVIFFSWFQNPRDLLFVDEVVLVDLIDKRDPALLWETDGETDRDR